MVRNPCQPCKMGADSANQFAIHFGRRFNKMRLAPLEGGGLRAPITPRLGGNAGRYRALAKSEPNEEI